MSIFMKSLCLFNHFIELRNSICWGIIFCIFLIKIKAVSEKAVAHLLLLFSARNLFTDKIHSLVHVFVRREVKASLSATHPHPRARVREREMPIHYSQEGVSR
jgi:hypothetical protein